MRIITLNTKEVARLKSAIRRGETNTQFQEFLDTLNSLVDQKTGRMPVSDGTFAAIEHFGSVVNKPSWQGLLFSIFGRTLSEAFANTERCTELIDIGKGVITPPAPDRNLRVL
jgi:hypothetical protein